MGYILELRKAVGSRPLIMAGAGVILINEQNEITAPAQERQRLLGLSSRLNGAWRELRGMRTQGSSRRIRTRMRQA